VLRGPEGGSVVLNAANEVGGGGLPRGRLRFDAIHEVILRTLAGALAGLG
jgi:1-deoxy-D-xylulose 5-phosphate reductoisomerase